MSSLLHFLYSHSVFEDSLLWQIYACATLLPFVKDGYTCTLRAEHLGLTDNFTVLLHSYCSQQLFSQKKDCDKPGVCYLHSTKQQS